jgi:DNA-binding MarR family transcriptional regulator
MNDITESTAFKLHRATVLIDRIADDYLDREHGIRYAPYLVLLIVRVLGEPSQQAIATNLDVSRASITQRVSGLVERGLLEIGVDPDDARAHRVRLTEAGRALVDAAWRGLESRQDGLDEGIDEPVFAQQLDRLIANAVTALSPKETP